MLGLKGGMGVLEGATMLRGSLAERLSMEKSVGQSIDLDRYIEMDGLSVHSCSKSQPAPIRLSFMGDTHMSPS